jgi:hypothetical protein
MQRFQVLGGVHIKRFLSLFWVAAVGTAFSASADRIRVERTPIDGGAELITWFEQLPEGELPILSALNDTLSGSEPGEDRLRQVWVYTFEPPSLGQRAESAVPFLYHRLWNETSGQSTPPRPVFDMGTPSSGIWTRVAMATVQAEVVNPAGAIARLTTQSYGGNLGEYQKTHVWEALDVISPAAGYLSDTGLTSDETGMLQSRLQLNGRMFSGLVGDEALPGFYEKYQTERSEVRGHNWELLRQSAEDNGLYFQPLTIGGMVNSFAMVWIAQDDLPCGQGDSTRNFDAKFLKIANPFGDASLCHWKGYSETRESVSGQTAMIPLALYSLDYPGVPLLLVDFRRAGGPTRSEMALRFTDEMTAGVLGLTGFGVTHLGYQALKVGWLFVHKRHGSATNRGMRRRAFVQLRHALGTDDTIEPALRTQLAHRVEKLDIDPLERSWEQEMRGARAQYDALIKDAKALPKLVRADREQEARAMAHGAAARALFRVASVSTFGLYRHEDLKPGTLEQIAEARRGALSKRVALLPEAGE